MKKLVSGILSTALFIGSGIPASAISDYGYKRPSIDGVSSNRHFQNLNTGYRLKPGERIVKEKDFLGLPKDNGEAVILDAHNKVKGFLKYSFLANKGNIPSTNEIDYAQCLSAIITTICSIIAVAGAPELVLKVVAEHGLKFLGECIIRFIEGEPLSEFPDDIAQAIKELQSRIDITGKCMDLSV